jgi:hypothetical protein
MNKYIFIFLNLKINKKAIKDISEHRALDAERLKVELK